MHLINHQDWKLRQRVQGLKSAARLLAVERDISTYPSEAEIECNKEGLIFYTRKF